MRLHSLLTNAGGGIKESSIEDGQDIPVHGSLGSAEMGSGEDAADGCCLHISELDCYARLLSLAMPFFTMACSELAICVQTRLRDRVIAKKLGIM